MRRLSVLCPAICAAVLLSTGQQASARNTPPVIKHAPVTVALHGQAIVIKANVTDDTKVKSVTLYYSTSKDVAPFKLDMQPAGQDNFVCTVPADLLGYAVTMTYYIEAVDNVDQTSETRWYNVSIQPAKSGSKTEIKTGSEDESFWKTTALIGGGVALAGGAAAIIAANSGSSTPPPASTTNEHAGTYVGSATTQLEFPGQPPTTFTHGTTITIDANGTVTSADLYEGQILTATLNGSQFRLTAHVSGTNLTGLINYDGSALSGRISGLIGGTAQAASGTNGTYYGNFYAVKQ